MRKRGTLGVTGGLMVGSFALGAVLVGSAVGVMAQDQSAPAGLVTEEVEPGVARIVSDGAGHDLEAKHPTYRYDMDDVFVAPDGTVWVSSSYRESDNDANGPGGGLVWAVGQPDTARYPGGVFCFRGTFDNPGLTGVTCYDLAADTETKYLAGTGINAVAQARMAPSGPWVLTALRTVVCTTSRPSSPLPRYPGGPPERRRASFHDV